MSQESRSHARKQGRCGRRQETQRPEPNLTQQACGPIPRQIRSLEESEAPAIVPAARSPSPSLPHRIRSRSQLTSRGQTRNTHRPTILELQAADSLEEQSGRFGQCSSSESWFRCMLSPLPKSWQNDEMMDGERQLPASVKVKSSKFIPPFDPEGLAPPSNPAFSLALVSAFIRVGVLCLKNCTSDSALRIRLCMYLRVGKRGDAGAYLRCHSCRKGRHR